jgi:hypothetical protein
MDMKKAWSVAAPILAVTAGALIALYAKPSIDKMLGKVFVKKTVTVVSPASEVKTV